MGEGGSTVPNYIALLVLCFYGAFLNLCGFYGWTLALLCGIFRSKRWSTLNLEIRVPRSWISCWSRRPSESRSEREHAHLGFRGFGGLGFRGFRVLGV